MAKYRLPTQAFFDRVILRHPKMVILCILAAVGILALGIRDFRLDASSENLVIESDQDLAY